MITVKILMIHYENNYLLKHMFLKLKGRLIRSDIIFPIIVIYIQHNFKLVSDLYSFNLPFTVWKCLLK